MNRLTIVSGKGGVGKTTVATALALASASRGERTLLVSLEGTDEQHPVFGLPFGYDPVSVPDVDGSLALLRLEAVPAVREYVRRRLPLGRLYDSAFESRAFRDFASATPGFEELMILGKLYDLITTGMAREIIFDAPATGHLRQLLKVPRATQEAVRFGPMYDIARKIEHRLKDPAHTSIVLPVLAEEMPLRETSELAAFLQESLGLTATLLLNRCLPTVLDATELARLETLHADQFGPGAAPEGWLLRCREAAAGSASQQDALEATLGDDEAASLIKLPQVTPPLDHLGTAAGDGWAFACNRAVAEALKAPLGSLAGEAH